jgi:hypothetical protein
MSESGPKKAFHTRYMLNVPSILLSWRPEKQMQAIYQPPGKMEQDAVTTNHFIRGEMAWRKSERDGSAYFPNYCAQWHLSQYCRFR